MSSLLLTTSAGRVRWPADGRATALGRIILTADEDFFLIVRDRFARDVSFPGLMFLKPHTDIGRAIRAIVHSTEAIDSDAQNWVKWLP